jgi:L-asparagine transporter-like permease
MRAVWAVAGIVVLIIVAAILLAVFNANPANSIVSEVHSWGHWLAGPFDGMFSFKNPKDAIAVNWGIAAVVYLLVAGIIALLIGRTTPETVSERNVSESLTQDEPSSGPTL